MAHLSHLRDANGCQPPLQLSSLAGLQKKCQADQRRTIASIGLLKSAQTRVSKEHRGRSPDRPTLDIPDSGELKAAFFKRSASQDFDASRAKLSAADDELDEDNDGIISLEEAFRAHAKACGKEETLLTVEEVIQLLTRCDLMDDYLTAVKIRLYFSTLEEGCNFVAGRKKEFKQDEIGYAEFDRLLQWAADLKGVKYSECVLCVIQQSLKLSDKSGNMMRKLQIVFEKFGRDVPNRMTSNEFALLCQQLNLYEYGKFSIGDAYLMFLDPEAQGGVDMNNFVKMVTIAGERLGIGNEIFRKFAEYIECQGVIQQNLARIRLKIKHAATSVGGPDWQTLFREVDEDGTGKIEWGEFLSMCRKQLQLTERSNHLRVLFESLDEDGSGEITLDELIRFVGNYR
eukprot:TRINITY_DN13356_c0_g1_i1.p1 TRINITY_DN13356_c0_g1~~TRINITY_DN13356_c0_g1_i1.p1  ORF type:complete len:400 (+),score=90.72 TRINITY_DN13356_c0_g1_i1:79-1278(+)